MALFNGAGNNGNGANAAYVSLNPICREINWDRATKEILARVEAAAIANPDRVQNAFYQVQDYCKSMVVRRKYSELLVKHGANVQEEFIDAVKYAKQRVLQHLLLDHYVDIEALDDADDTPLIAGVKKSQIHLVRELVAAGADVDARDAAGADVLTLVQGINSSDITNILAKACEINDNAFLSEKAKKVLKFLAFSGYVGNCYGENYKDDARYADTYEKAIGLAEKLDGYDEFTQKFVIVNNRLLDDALSPDFGTWDVEQMEANKILVNFAYHHVDKVIGIGYLCLQDKATVLSTMNSLFDGAGNLVCHSIGEYAARVVAKTPEMNSEGGELVIKQELWKNITSYLSPSDVVLSAATPVDPSQAGVTLVGAQHPHVPTGDGLTCGLTSLEE